MKNLKRIAILGRPNVGKSTLFNRLVGKRMAIVHDEPGVTRDWREAPAKLSGLRFSIIDTAGLEGFENFHLKGQIDAQTQKILDACDLILFVIDGREGVTSSDQVLAQKARLTQKPVLLLINKCEGGLAKEAVLESYQLGFEDPIPFSAEHGEGLGLLYDQLRPYIDADLEAEENFERDREVPLKIAIVGRPNVGKSTLINTLIGEERLLTGDQPGVTRDAIRVPFIYQGKKLLLADTAGLRRKARIEESLEKASTSSTLEAIRYAQVVILVVDALEPLNKQDLTIASLVVREGRALVIALNKWDQADHSILPDLKHRLESALSQVSGVPFIPLSALKNKNIDKLMSAVMQMEEAWNKRITTAALNRWLTDVEAHHPPPIVKGSRIRLKYITQVKTRPPTFSLFLSKASELPNSYVRYLEKKLRDDFNLMGVPLRLQLRQGKNPYDARKK